MRKPLPPLAQSGLTLLAVACALAVFFAVRWSMAAGLFHSVTPVSPGVCRVIATLPGPEDFQIDAPHNTIFVSSTDRRHPGRRDGLYVLTLNDPAAAPVRLAGVPDDFHPHGISLYRAPDGSETLMAVNHRQSGQPAVEIFSLSFAGGMPKLNHQATIAGGLLVSPSHVFAVGPDQFYVANDHVTRGWLGRFAEDDLLWAHADLLYFNGMSFKIAVQRIGFPNGVFVSPDGGHLYVAAASARRLIAFSREPFLGALAEIGSLSIPAWLDNITMDAGGRLLVAGHPSLPRDRAFQADPGKPSPSEIFRVTLDVKGVPQSYDTLYADDGHQIGAASSALVLGKRLLIGSTLDSKMLDCALK